MTFRPCILIPTYNNPDTVRDVVLAVRKHLKDVVVVDDGSAEAGKDAVAALGEEKLAIVFHRPQNGGKGAAVKSGFQVAAEHGFSHALQVDADGQHALDDIPKLLKQAEENPAALILGAPQYDESAPKARRIARKITRFWINRATGGRKIADAMCGFRVYPIASVKDLYVSSDAMDFDPEIAVRLAWLGLQIINIPTSVRYFEEGVSHFRVGKDNMLIAWMHTRLMFERSLRLVFRRPLRLP